MNQRQSPFTEWVRILVSPSDKQLLREISEHFGSASEAGTVRKLIRDEGRRLGISTETHQQPQPEPTL